MLSVELPATSWYLSPEKHPNEPDTYLIAVKFGELVKDPYDRPRREEYKFDTFDEATAFIEKELLG